jgi:hypothetical protein
MVNNATHAPRNLQAASLSLRAGGAAVAIAGDTRPKVVRAKKGKGSYDRRRVSRRLDD